MIAINEIKKNYGNEMAAILLCCRVFFETATLAALTDFVNDNGINWNLLANLTRRHRVRPIVYKALNEISLPAEIKRRIRNEQTETILNGWKLAIETERIILLLRKHEIEVVPYKGAAFSKQFFGDLISRESSDIDLIIEPAYLSKAIAILTDDGYLPELEDIRQYLGEKYYSYFKDYNLNKYQDGNRVFHVELHWAIAEKFVGADPEINKYLYNACQNVSLAKENVKTLDRVAHFSCVLIHHALKDNFGQLKNIVDVAQAFKHADIRTDITRLTASFNAHGLKKALAVNQLLAQQLMGITCSPAPLQVDINIQNYFLNQACSVAVPVVDDKKKMLKWMNDTALLQDSATRRFRFYMVCLRYRFIPGTKDFRAMQPPKALFFLYYLVKPFRTWIDPHDALEEKKETGAGKLTTVDEDKAGLHHFIP